MNELGNKSMYYIFFQWTMLQIRIIQQTIEYKETIEQCKLKEKL